MLEMLIIYEDKPFVKLKVNSELHDVVGSNYTDIGFQYNKTHKYSQLFLLLII